ncbi:CU044_5270 family protein [Embleya sp. NPDC050154]|uniref:CU044_5270 family protein n=1 Tax=Embleya sp. NPDC050154 TaxID=3363988 RepID=UPI0037AE059D
MKYDVPAPEEPTMSGESTESVSTDRARPAGDPTERALVGDARPTPARQRLLEEHLMRAITADAARTAAPRRRARRLLAPIGAMVAVGAVAAAVFLVAAPDPTTRRPAQTAAAPDASAVPRPGQVLYVELETSSWSAVDGVPVEIPPHARKEWFAQDGRRWFLDEPGSPVSGLVLNDRPMRWNYAELAALPATPEAVSAALRGRDAWPGGGKVDPDQAVFDEIRNILDQGVLPPGIAEALYEVAARTPGVVAVADAVDGRGRRGIGLNRTDPVTNIRGELVFERGSRVFLGTRGVLATPGENHPNGTVMWETTVLKRDIVDIIPGDPVAEVTGSRSPSTTSHRRP